MDVLVTGGDTELGRTVAQTFGDAGHRVTITGARREELEVTAKELDVDAVVCDSLDAAALAGAVPQLPQHLDTIVNVPTPVFSPGDPRTYTLAERAQAWRAALDGTVLSAVLTVSAVGDHLRSGGSIVTVVAENPKPGSADAAAKAAVADWTSGQAEYFGTRGITINAVAAGRGTDAGYDGVTDHTGGAAAEIARLALFLTGSAARHITGQTLHVGHRALDALR
ncbi:SDR family oxidoreductase [Mycobacterium sp. MYCO198283]|uniref:SDR family oxidoreductase n=1 Tax=Mycobacterium sp. MYCO198283 TaxID=2883505 RepID=UPI001E367341|nr:SDR family oxidoreductase [Mycobacterium sp. MYCO198283]MCG5433209.1 SDR family oxidoreductase [Mycobacterium sp. MYCO198283]